jgi:CelD/BcsL family acetyltransferase involved in cellulose biosynthesis
LPDTFSAYLEEIDGKQRREIRRKLRNLESSFLDGELVFANDPDRLHDEVDVLMTMMARDPLKRDFLTEAMRQHLHNIAQVAFENGWLKLAFFMIDGEKAAANMSFNFNKRLWLYNSGWEWEYREFPPGWLLLAYLIEWATEQGIQEFDFLRGDEVYKYKFGGIDRHVC